MTDLRAIRDRLLRDISESAEKTPEREKNSDDEALSPLDESPVMQEIPGVVDPEEHEAAKAIYALKAGIDSAEDVARRFGVDPSALPSPTAIQRAASNLDTLCKQTSDEAKELLNADRSRTYRCILVAISHSLKIVSYGVHDFALEFARDALILVLALFFTKANGQLVDGFTPALFAELALWPHDCIPVALPPPSQYVETSEARYSKVMHVAAQLTRQKRTRDLDLVPWEYFVMDSDPHPKPTFIPTDWDVSRAAN